MTRILYMRNIKSRIFSLCVLIATSVAAMHAQQTTLTIDSLFAEMPDSVLPYLSRNNRLDLIDFSKASMKAVVTNSFDEDCEMEQLADNYLRIRLNGCSIVEMKLKKADRLLPDSSEYMLYMLAEKGEKYTFSYVKNEVLKGKVPYDSTSLKKLKDELHVRR